MLILIINVLNYLGFGKLFFIIIKKNCEQVSEEN